MNDFVLVTDSTTDLPAKLAEASNIIVVPLKFSINGVEYKNYLDNREMSSQDFYNQVRKGAQPTTSQVNPDEYISVLKPYLDSGKDVLILAFSSALSGTFNSSRIATDELKELYPNRKIITIDTKSASLGEGLLVYLTAMFKQTGKSIDETHEYVCQMIPKIAHWFTVDDLKHLRRGGRISAMASFVGSIAKIKPIMHTNDEGKLIPRTKTLGRKKSIKALFEEMVKTAEPIKQTVFIGHGDDLEAAQTLATMIEEHFDVEKLVINPIGPVIGSHTGQGVLALFFIAKHR